LFCELDMKRRIAWLGVTAVWLVLLPGFLFAGAPTAVTLTPTPTPTRDRLAAPPTVAAPTQADEGAQLYWLHCQPCHGDEGQGLTDEWRAQYPPEDQNCWNSGCHGPRPYEAGFILPTAVPAIIGDGTLSRFHSLGQIYTFIQATMPYQAPGTLTEAEYLAITAFLERAHGRGDGISLIPDNLPHNTSAPEPVVVTEVIAEEETSMIHDSQVSQWSGLFPLIVAAVVTAVAVVILLRIRK
jgi:mono/diheme cytochrome c family protein